MYRLWTIALVAACATEPDTRPETADYIIEAIIAPSCGHGGCHSSVTVAAGYALDTITAAKAAMTTNSRKGRLVIPGSPSQSELVTILTDTRKPMPADAPLPQADIDLITRWVADGAAGL
jgi:hypothetical protein